MKKVAKRYSKALFDSINPNEWDSASFILHSFAELFSSNNELKNSLSNPAFSLRQRSEVLNDVVKIINGSDGSNFPQLNNFFLTLLNNARLNAVAYIAEDFSELVNIAKKILAIKIISASEISKEKKDYFLQAIQKEWGSSAAAEWKVDPDLLGGAVIKIGDKMIDSSVKGRLQSLKDDLL